jgi:hypothetical protein
MMPALIYKAGFFIAIAIKYFLKRLSCNYYV